MTPPPCYDTSWCGMQNGKEVAMNIPPPPCCGVQNGKKVAMSMRDTSWWTMTCKIGFDVMGIWPDGSDRTDINSVTRSRLGAP